MSQINIGNIEVDRFYLGDGSDITIYLGDVKLYPTEPPYKVKVYTSSSARTIECNSSTTLTSTEARGIIGGQGFSQTAVTQVEIGSCVESLSANCFSGFTNMTAVTIGDNVTTLGNQAFRNCSSLGEVSFPSRLDFVDGSCFRYASGISRIDLPYGTTRLGSGAFADMTGLTAATIPSTVSRIDTNLFLRDTRLDNVHLYRMEAPEMGANMFSGCTSLQRIYIPSCDCFESYAPTAAMSGFSRYIYSEATDLPCGSNFKFIRHHVSGDYTYAPENTVSNLNTAQTRSGSSISVITGSTDPATGVTLGDYYASASNGAFSAWTRLETAEFVGITRPYTLSQYMFARCTSLRSVDLGRYCTSIGNNAFSACTSLTSITISSDAPPTLNSTSYIPASVEKIYIKCGTISSYSSNSVWGNAALFAKLEEVCNERWVDSGLTACIGGYVTHTEEQQKLVGGVWTDTGVYRALEATSEVCTNTPVIRGDSWLDRCLNPVYDSGGNLVYVIGTASNASELSNEKGTITASGIESISFSVGGANNSGFKISSEVHGVTYSDSVKASGTYTLSGLMPRNTYTIDIKLLKRDGQYYDGTNANIDISWT